MPETGGAQTVLSGMTHADGDGGTHMGEPTRRYKVGYFVGSLSSTSINRILSGH